MNKWRQMMRSNNQDKGAMKEVAVQDFHSVARSDSESSVEERVRKDVEKSFRSTRKMLRHDLKKSN